MVEVSIVITLQNFDILLDKPKSFVLSCQLIEETTTMEYTSPQPTGIIPAHSTVEVPLVITPQALEKLMQLLNSASLVVLNHLRWETPWGMSNSVVHTRD